MARVACDLEGQPALAAAARADERQQPSPLQQAPDLGHFYLPSDEPGRRGGENVGPRFALSRQRAGSFTPRPRAECLVEGARLRIGGGVQLAVERVAQIAVDL